MLNGQQKNQKQRYQFVTHNQIISKAPHWLVNLVRFQTNFEITSLDILIRINKLENYCGGAKENTGTGT